MLTKFLMIVLGVLLLATNFSARPQAQGDDPMQLLVDTPVIGVGPTGSFNAGFNEPGAMLYHDEQFHMFLTGYGGFPRPNGIAYLVSDDAIEWTNPLGDALILTGDDVPGAFAVNASSVLIEPDGTWVLDFGDVVWKQCAWAGHRNGDKQRWHSVDANRRYTSMACGTGSKYGGV